MSSTRLLVAAVMTIAGTGCGSSGPSDKSQISTALNRFTVAAGTAEGAKACSYLSLDPPFFSADEGVGV